MPRIPFACLGASLRRRIGEQIRIAVVDTRTLPPDLRIKSGWQSESQFRVRQPAHATAIAGTAALRLCRGVDVPIDAAEMQIRFRRSCSPACRGGTFGAALYDPEGVGVVDFAALAAAHH